MAGGRHSSFYSNRYGLKLTDAASQLPAEVLLSDPNYYTALFYSSYGQFTMLYPTNDLVLVAADTSPGIPNITTMFVSYNTSGGKLKEISRIYAPPGVTAQSGGSAPIPGTKKFLSIAAGYETVGKDCDPPTPYCNPLFSTFTEIGHITDENGVIDPVPALEYDLSQIDPHFLDFIPTIAGMVTMSTDGEYVLMTYSVHDGINPFAVAAQKQAMMKIVHNSSGVFLEKKGEMTYPSTGIPNTFYYGQVAVVRPLKYNKYLIVLSTISFNLVEFNLKTIPSTLFVYIYDEVDGSFTLVGEEFQPQTLQNLWVSPNNKRIVTQVEVLKTEKPTLMQFAPDANLTVPDPEANLRLYDLTIFEFPIPLPINLNKLEYRSGKELNGAHCWGGVYSPKGDLFAHTCTPGGNKLAVTLPAAIPNPIFPNGTVGVPTPAVLTLASTNAAQLSFELEDWAPAPQLGIAMMFSPDGTKLFVGGQDSPTTKGAALYEITKQY